MTQNSQKIRFFRRHIPQFECTPGCHDCCGPVTASSEEAAQLPPRSPQQRAAALAEWACPYLGKNGCEAYLERPLICRLFGTTPRLVCPNGKSPAVMTDPRTEEAIYRYLAETRQVLI
ncbi:MAG: YkgJ family cysteine cluster protein [Rhodocyclales bacterium]|nr:YkgJ family cysteine cluster protein [Rhodocyclales bacterium]